ncbi:MAG: RagB/SusD family nutrient uptake outer membrane protein [Mesonia hippocampi]|uniref:RagB/SusD family nutrient uptake outer membrane protein n=1 Tax=Mesonia hippocampi TaxID=1628250 RepID=UPI003F9DE5C3
MKLYRNKTLMALALGSVISLASCSDDFLETNPNEFVTDQDIIDESEHRPEIQEGILRGLYATMYEVGSGGSTRPDHDDFGQKGYDIYTDMISGDMVLGSGIYGWYSQVSNLQATQDFTNSSNYYPWRYYYRIIFSANQVIENLIEDGQLPTGSDNRHILGQALGMRAYSYFNLAQLFQEGYDPNEEILPLYLTKEDSNSAQPLSKASDVYNLIIEDLETAKDLMDGFNRSVPNQINKDVATGMLAYAYAAIGNKSDAATNALEVINDGNFQLLTREETAYDSATQTGSGFNSVENSNWMWGVDITLDAGLDLVSWWGQVDIFTYSYASVGDAKAISQELYDSMRPDDIRKNQFVDAFGDGLLLPINKFYTPKREVQGQRYIETDYVYMRIEEMYLLYAENIAATNETEAKIKLKEFLQNRLTDVSYVDALSGQALLDEIYLQTRIELWGEGKSYYAMKRNKATVTYPSNHLYYPGQQFSYDADELTFEIPEAEVINNPHI